MNLLAWLKKLFASKPAPQPPVPPVNPVRPIAVVVYGSAGPLAGAKCVLSNIPAIEYPLTNTDGYTICDVSKDLRASHLFVTANGYAPYDCHVDLPDHGTDLVVGGTARPDQIQLPPLVPLVTFTIRKGLVRNEGRDWVDDDGPFYPLGDSLFWALRGWKFDRDRVKANIDYIAKFNHDYVRILCHCLWPGNEIDSTWPDFPQVLAEFIDYAYSRGVRTEVTILGGSTNINLTDLCNKIINVVRERPEKILDIEMANEWYSTGVTLPTMMTMSNQFMAAGIKNILALSSAEGGVTLEEARAGKMRVAGATMQTIHMDRGAGDDGWRAVRQPWDWKDLGFAVSHNEPIGPGSSVSECTNPLQLAMLRATGIVCGVGAFVLHSGSGVYGVAYTHPSGMVRYANLWEVPGIDAMMQAVRNVDKGLPTRIAGRMWNLQWAGNPCPADSVWPNNPTGVNRQYMCDMGDQLVFVLNGVHDHVTVTPQRPMRLEVYDPVTAVTHDHSGGPVTVATGAYIVRGFNL